MSGRPGMGRAVPELRNIDIPMPQFDDRWPPCAQIDPELFFPTKGESVTEAKAACNGDWTGTPCRLREKCLEFALALPKYDDHGVWGGVSQNERRRIRADRRKQAKNRAEQAVDGPVTEVAA